MDKKAELKIKNTINDIVKGRFDIVYRHSKTTNSFYFKLIGIDNVYYNMRFSDHYGTGKTKTFIYKNRKQKDLEKFIKYSVTKMEIKNTLKLIDKLSLEKRVYNISV